MRGIRWCAPGGYEWWYFDAEDREHDRQLVAILFQGFVFHPGYLRRYFKYRSAAHATRAAGSLTVSRRVLRALRGGAALAIHDAICARPVPAATDRAEVAVGPNLLHPDDDGSLALILRGTPWELTWKGPKLLDSSEVVASMRFTPAPVARAARTHLPFPCAGSREPSMGDRKSPLRY